MKERNERIDSFRKYLYELPDDWGFCEREACIDRFLKEGEVSEIQAVRYTDCLEKMLGEISTPVNRYELLLGNVIQGEIAFPMEMVPGDGYSHVKNPFTVYDRCAGHCCPDYELLLQGGLRRILEEVRKTAGDLCTVRQISNEISDSEQAGRKACQRLWAECAERCVASICAFAKRYSTYAEKTAWEQSDEKRKKELQEAAQSLGRVPYGPAESFRDALQSVWFIHMILSCLAGGRDFAFGRMDQYLYPFYEEDLKHGRLGREEALTLLADFLLKCNEFGGRTPVQMNYKEKPDYKPVPCASTKQYLVLGGYLEDGGALCNELSFLFLEAALLVRLPEPVLVVRMCNQHPQDWKDAVNRAAQELQGQITVFNDDVIVPRLIDLGQSPEKAVTYVMTGCNGVTFPGCQHTELYHNAPEWITDLLGLTEERDHVPAAYEDFLEEFEQKAYLAFKNMPPARRIRPENEASARFHLESLFFTECRKNMLDIENGGQDQEYTVHFVAGAATVIDSLYTIDRLVYQERRFSLPEFSEILRKNFAGQERLLTEIRNFPKFGNDRAEIRPYTEQTGKIITDAMERVNREDDGRLHSGGFYALYWQYKYGSGLPATPDGRLAGDPISENMSPSYGNDQSGLTALLTELSHMSLRQCTTGGLNIKFTRMIEEKLCSHLFDTFFQMGGINYAVIRVDPKALKEAKKYPEQYRDLCVRITGYSEFFIKLPEHIQDEIIARTEVEDLEPVRGERGTG